MKELTSRRNKENVQRVSDETYALMVKKGLNKRFFVRDIPSRPLKDTPAEIATEKKTEKPKGKNIKKDGKNN
jgi:hypothetical protein